MRAADSSPDGPLRHSRSRSKRAPCHHLIRPLYWFHNHLCMLRDMSKMHIWHVQPQESNTAWNDQSHPSSLFYKAHLSETFRMFFQCSLTSTACTLFIWTPWIAQNNKCAFLEMQLGQVVCLLHLSVLSPFYHHVEMAKGGGLRWPIISLHLAYLEHVAVSVKWKNCCTREEACFYV